MTQVAVGKDVELGAPDDEAKTLFPALWHWLATQQAGPDHLKDPARVSVRLLPGGALASLSDDAYGVSLDASSETLLGAFQALEEALNQPHPAFRTWNRKEVKVRKKPKKD